MNKIRDAIPAPLIITPRLMVGVRVGNGFISIATEPRSGAGRTGYRVIIDLPDGAEHQVYGLRSGRQGGDVRGGMVSLLSFLNAAVEARRYRERMRREFDPDDCDTNERLFEPAVVDWACDNCNEIESLSLDLEECDDDTD
jgi:hypothetical protein